MSETTKTTQLEAINAMLAAVGEQPVTALAAPYPADVAVALRILEDTQKEILSEGWLFNTEDQVSFTPAAGAITLAEDIISVDTEPGAYPKFDITLRGTSLYDRVTNTTNSFGTDPIKLNLIRMLPLASIPQTFRRWIVAAATTRFYDAITETKGQHQGLIRAEFDAKRAAKAQDGDNYDLNIFNSYDAGRMVYRANALIRVL